MHLIHPNRTAARGFGTGGAAMLPRTARKVRAVVRKLHAAIAAARLHHRRDELISRGAAPERQSRMPPVLGDKWDF